MLRSLGWAGYWLGMVMSTGEDQVNQLDRCGAVHVTALGGPRKTLIHSRVAPMVRCNPQGL